MMDAHNNNDSLFTALGLSTGEFEAAFPLTSMQRDLYVDALLNAGQGHCSIGYTFEVHAALDTALWQRALEMTVAACPALRTSIFPAPAGDSELAYQCVRRQVPVPLELHDLSAAVLPEDAASHRLYPGDAPVAPLEALVHQTIYREYDPQGPLIAYALVKLGESRYLSVLAGHHAVLDASGFAAHCERTCANYEALLRGETPALASDNYQAFIADTRQRFDTAETRRRWETLALGVEAITAPGPAGPVSGAGKMTRTAYRVGPEQWQRINAYCERTGLKPHLYFKALYALMIRVYCQPEADFVLADVKAGRSGEFAKTVSCAIQQAPFVCRAQHLVPQASFTELFDYTRNYRRLLGDAHDISISLQNELLPRSAVSFTYNYIPFDLSSSFLGQPARQRHLKNDAHGQVQFCPIESEGGVTLDVYYYPEEFLDNRFAERVAYVSDQVLAGADRISEIDFLLPDEKQQLAAWNATAVDYPASPSVHARIEAQVLATPEAVAAEFEAEQLSYRQLNRRANQLAAQLRQQGVGRGDRVALVLERSLEMVVAILGVLKAGAAYVPIDPEAPADRVDYMLETSGASVILTLNRLRAGLQVSVPVVELDSVAWTDEARFDTNPEVGVSPEDRFNVIFTSGSTGRPKGVMVPHGGILNRIAWMQAEYGLTAADRILQKTPYSFDVSVWEFIWPLFVGARMVFAQPGGHKDPNYLVDLIAAKGITTLHFVPSMLAVFLQGRESAQPLAMRRVFCSGEALPMETVRRFCSRFPNVELHNLYGPTEASVDVSYWPCDPKHALGLVPIGKPVANTQLHILGRNLEPLPVGVAGELHIGGVQLALGYIQRPELTAEKFIPDPFAKTPGARLYKTGDLARCLADGNIDYLGRIDHQVKLRGFRIELGELEAVATEFPGVQQSLVMLQEVHPGQNDLVAYLAVGDTASFDLDGVKAHLSAKLPEYMVPAYWVLVPTMPLSPNGKLDRKALPAPEIASAGAYEAPRSKAETVICEVLAATLGRDRLGIRDDFFNLGGHSLLAAKAMAKICDQLGVDLPLKALFAARTPEKLAALAEQQAAQAGTRVAEPPLVSIPRGGSLPLSFGQERLWLLDRMEGERSAAAFLMPMVLRVSGSLDETALRAALNDILARHEALRTVFREEAGVAQAHLLAPAPMPLVVEELAGATAEQVQARLKTLAASRFDLSREPAIKAWLLRLGADDARLVIVAHHVNFDGYSIGIVLRELGELYAAHLAGRPATLAAPGCQYPDFAAWQRQLLSGERLSRRLDYWKQTLACAPAQLRLPTDKPRPAVLGSAGRNACFRFSSDEFSAIDRYCKAHGLTLYMFLMAAYAVLLHKLSGQTDIVIGSGAANRGREQLDDMVGFVANVWALRTRLDGNPSIAEVLARVRSEIENSVDAQDTPFEAIVEAVNPPRSSAYSPIFQAMLVLQNAAGREITLPGARLNFESMPDVHFAHDCLLQLYLEGDSIAGEWAYNTDLFNEASIQRWAELLRHVAMQMCSAPEQSLAALALPGASINAGAIRKSLLASGVVADCAVLNRPTVLGAPRAVAYLVPNGAYEEDVVVDALRTTLEGAMPLLVPVARIPLDAQGEVDFNALALLPVVNEHWRAACEQQLPAQLGSPEVALTLAAKAIAVPHLPMTDLLAGLASHEAPAAADEQPQAAVPSLALGAELVFEEGAPTTLGGALRRAAAQFADHGVRYLAEDAPDQFETYAELLDRSERVLSGLRQSGLPVGSKVLFLLPKTANFVAAFWGCVLGGYIPVPLTAPKLWDSVNADLLRMRNTWQLLGKPLIVTSQELLPKASGIAALLDCPEMRLLTVDAMLQLPRDSQHHDNDPDTPALFLLTSGSTGTPKAVQQTHRAILSRTRAQQVHNGDCFDDTSFNWMPIDHVGGIVMFHIRDTYVGAQQVHAPTELVLADPLRWLDIMDKYKVSVTWAPNFAFGLINECEGEMASRQWDLSSLRFILNAGEAIVPKTARKFMRLLAPHGLPGDSMKPCWGMSETCSGVTYHANFRLDTTSDRDLFCEVGSPIPGFAFRIVDEANRVLPEGTVGKLQVRGPNVTIGYYDNAEANAEALQPEGWFETGDLGVCRQGSLAITGRAKDLIIINGINYVGHEIEKFVEELDCVEGSYTAAVAVRVSDRSGGNTDKLAIFFVPRTAEAGAAAIVAIRAQVLRKMGLRPDFVIPVTHEEIPKTSIGKIQRTQLSKRFEAGEFRSRVENAGDEGVPHYFMKRVWVPRKLEPAPLKAACHWVIGSSALADQLAEGWTSQGNEVARDVQTIAPCRARIVCVLGPQAGMADVLAVTVQLTQTGLSGALWFVTQGLTKLEALPGVVRTLGQEMPELSLALLDIDAGASVEQLLAEFASIPAEPEVRLRQGERLVSRLQSLEFAPEKLQPVIRPGAAYVVTGGLGGIGQWVCRHLLERHGASLLVLGSSDLDASAARKATLSSLSELGAVRYAAVDVADAPAVAEALAAAESVWVARGIALAGAFHLAGSYEECAFGDETPESFAKEVRAKVGGAQVLEQLLAQRSDAVLVSFSSVAGYFGGSMIGAYAGANAALASMAEHQGHIRHSRHICLNWSNWADTGMSAGYGARALSEARGYRFLAPAEALDAMELALVCGENNVYVGLDSSKAMVRRALAGGDVQWLEARAYSTSDSTSKLLGHDSLALPIEIALSHVQTMPRTADGKIDYAQLGSSTDASTSSTQTERIAPRNELEQQIAGIVQEILRKPGAVGVTDNFFDLGMTSLVLSRLHHKLKADLGLKLSLVDLFRFTSIEKLISHLQPAEDAPGQPAKADEIAEGAARADLRRAALGRRQQRSRGRDQSDE